jgi:hypothetical protein
VAEIPINLARDTQADLDTGLEPASTREPASAAVAAGPLATARHPAQGDPSR